MPPLPTAMTTSTTLDATVQPLGDISPITKTKQQQLYAWKFRQEALQIIMQKDHATHHKYETSNLKRLAIGNDLQ